jgi:hypothetical protein
MFRMTAHNRETAFQAFNTAVDAIAHYRTAKTADSRAFERDVIRESIMAARMLRLNGIDYPSIP